MTGATIANALALLAAILFIASAGYGVAALICVRHFERRLARPVPPAVTAPVTLLKPLHGLECEFEDNLRSFCRQDYGTYQIVFGVRDADDPAIAVVRRIISEFPERDIGLVIDDRQVGANQKVGNLVNMMAAAKHDILIVSDSDMRVAPDYIARMVAPFAAPEVGTTTALYAGSARGGLASKLGALYINDWFFPSSLLAVALGELKYCFGATIAIRRPVLDAIGGFAALADYIADDYVLGRLTIEKGWKIALAPYVIENIVHEPNLTALFRHELRWARTIRSVQPAGYAASAITELFALSLLSGAAASGATESLALGALPPALALVLRVALHRSVWVSQARRTTYNPWLIPLRDLLTPAVRIASYFGTTVHWREQVLTIQQGSVSHEPTRSAARS